MLQKLKGKYSLISAVFFAVLLSVLRSVQLNYAVEYPTGFYAEGKDWFNIIFIVILVSAAVTITLLTVVDLKGREVTLDAPIKNLSRRGNAIIGVFMILGGAALSMSVMHDIGTGNGVLLITDLAGCIAYIVGGFTVIVGVKVVPAHCISAVFIIISYIVKSITYYLANTIIVGMPQKFMTMMFYVLTALFWINCGRVFSGAAKKLTLYATIASGFFCSAAALATNISGFVLALTDGSKWMNLSDTADVELLVTSLIPAAIAFSFLALRKKEDKTE